MGTVEYYFRPYTWAIMSMASIHDVINERVRNCIFDASQYVHFKGPKEYENQFIIDPRTSIFTCPPITFRTKHGVKLSYKKLAMLYDGVINEKYAARNLLPSDFSPTEIENLAKRSFYIQKYRPEVTKTEVKFYKTATENNTAFHLAPYFFITNTQDPWYDVNIKLLDKFIQVADGEGRPKPLIATIALQRELLLRPEELVKIIKDYNSKNVAGFAVWVDGFDETTATKEELDAYFRLLIKLKGVIIMLYGGTFSLIVALHKETVIVSSCMCIFDKRLNLVPTGGRACTRYYVPKLLAKFRTEQAEKLASEMPEILCGCRFCGGAFPTNIDAHNIEAWVQEINDFNAARDKQRYLSGKLLEAIKISKELDGDFGYLQNWKSVAGV